MTDRFGIDGAGAAGQAWTCAAASVLRGWAPEPAILLVTFGLVLACRAAGLGDGALLGATPASGVALFAAVVRRGSGALAAAAGFGLAGLAVGLAADTALADAAAHGLAALAGAATMRALARRRRTRSRVSDWLILLVGVFVFAATVAVTLLAAGIAGAEVAGIGPARAAVLAAAFEPLGLLIAGAAIASAGEAERVRADPLPALGTAALGVGLLAAFWALLGASFGPSPSGLILVLSLPFCLWVAMQPRSLDGAVLAFVAALVALVILRARIGPVDSADFVTATVYLTVVVATCQLVHAVNRDRLAALAEVEARVDERTARLAAMSERAVAADAAKTRFLATVSHEVRTPLSGVLGMASVVLADDDLDPGVRRSVETIRSSGMHLLDVINRHLDFSRLESRRGGPDEAPFDVVEVVEEVLGEARFLPYAAGLALVSEIEPGLAPVRIGHRATLRQVLTNLVGNAAKFTDEGTVTVAMRATGDGGELRIEVRDTGVGVPPEARERIFLPYEQLESCQHVGGSGLGLAICADMIRRIDGRLGVDCAPGGGSVFWFEVPLPPAGAPGTV